MADKYNKLMGLSVRLQFTTAFISAVGIAFGVKSYVHVRDEFGVDASAVFLNDLWVQVGIAIAINVVAGILIFKTVTKPIDDLSQAMEALSDDDLDVEVPSTDKSDEIGVMARLVDVFKDNAIRMKEMEEEQLKAREEAKAERTRMREEIASEFDQKVRGITEMVASTAGMIDEASQAMSGSAESNNDKISHLTELFDKTNENVSSVATAVEELAASINEISQQANSSSSMANAAAEEAEKAGAAVQGLAQAAEHISEVIELINELAEQINLLALNATIEAARAGEAGKGFDVVASEVKNLSRQTESATEEISKHVSSIQSETNGAVELISSLAKRIEEMSSVATSISSAVEQQNASTRDISDNVNNAASNTKEVQVDVQEVAAITKGTGNSAKEMMMATADLAKQSEALNGEVASFLQKMRSA